MVLTGHAVEHLLAKRKPRRQRVGGAMTKMALAHKSNFGQTSAAACINGRAYSRTRLSADSSAP